MNLDDAPLPEEAVKALGLSRRVLGDALVAVWLHGSAVAGGLRSDSDVDLLAVIDQETTPRIRGRLMQELMRLSGRPGSSDRMRPIELIVVHDAALHPSAFPRRSEFVYGEWLRDGCEAGIIPEPGSDPELSVVLAEARQNAKVLMGSEPRDLLPEIGDDELRRAMASLLPQLLAGLHGDERNVLLTLARMWRTLATGEIVPKDVAAAWAQTRLSADAATLVGHARDAYLGKARDDWTRSRDQAARAASALRDRIGMLL